MKVAFNTPYLAAEFATVGVRRSRVQEAAEGGSCPASKLLAIMAVSVADDYGQALMTRA